MNYSTGLYDTERKSLIVIPMRKFGVRFYSYQMNLFSLLTGSIINAAASSYFCSSTIGSWSVICYFTFLYLIGVPSSGRLVVLLMNHTPNNPK